GERTDDMSDPAVAPPAGDDPLAPRYCLRCQVRLPNRIRAEGACPRCGLQFDARDPRTYRPDRESVRWHFWVPGFLLAVAAGISSYAICLQAGELGNALFVAVPASVGAILGFGCRVRTWGLLLLAGMAIASVVTALVAMDFAGLFCGGILAII